MATGRPKKRLCRASAESSSSEDEAMPPVFPVGAEVEVRIDDPGFDGAFYEAIVVARLPTGDGYEVLYDMLEGDEGDPVLEHAAAANVRPPPPAASEEDGRSGTRSFAMREMVEASYNGGWWSGVVSADRGLPRVYKVAFPTTRESIDFEEAALRPRQVFQAGRWVPAAQAPKEGIGAGNTIKEAGKIRGVFEEMKEPRHGSGDVDLPSDATPAIRILPEISTVSSPVNLTQRNDNQGSPESSEIYEWRWYDSYVTIERSMLPTLTCGANGFFALVDGESIMNDRSSEFENLPFVKTSQVWAFIESMEIFRKTPQRPHFRHLQKYAPE